jgi:hypothetical protein
MGPTSSDALGPASHTLHPALRDLAAEGRAVAVRLLAYLCGIVMLAVIAADLVGYMAPEASIASPAIVASAAVTDWVRASRIDRAFAVNAADIADKSATYEVFRRSGGNRLDVMRWASDAGPTLAELTIERGGLGDRPPTAAAAGADVARRMSLSGKATPEAAGSVETKFGIVALWRAAQAGPDCLGFAKAFDAPRLRISGWSCAAKSQAAQKQLIGCTLDHLTLLSSGNNPDLAALFARAELRRGPCAAGATVAVDWVNGTEVPRLRGRL